MAAGHQTDTTWMWHPSFAEDREDTAGLFVKFRRHFTLEDDVLPPASLPIYITADTRYKLYVNGALVSYGPVKGDANLWFYDEVDVGPHLRPGENRISVVVLRFFHDTRLATSFPRLASGGLRLVAAPGVAARWGDLLGSGPLWETAIESGIVLRVDEPEDDFLHVYEEVAAPGTRPALDWTVVKVLEYQTSTGNSTPWSLSPRLIPRMRHTPIGFCAIHNIQSSVPSADWQKLLLAPADNVPTLTLPPDSRHVLDLETATHATAFIQFLFERAGEAGGRMHVTYSESYEDEPPLVPYLRRKGHRRDTTKNLYGPRDIYHFQGGSQDAGDLETFAPFHFRTFRFIRLEIETGPSGLGIRGITADQVNYPLEIQASLTVAAETDLPGRLWETSVRTLTNCMHDCYEDCPFYEQLQYAMDTRSSAMFTYYVSGDDRLARQAMIQLHNSFQARTGLVASRSPSHATQIIPHFSLFWVSMLTDHWAYFGDKTFLTPFLPVVDAVLGYFLSRVDPELGLVRIKDPGAWNFVDWAEDWRPYGIPPSAVESGVSTYTSSLCAYTLKQAASLMGALGRASLAQDYLSLADGLVQAVRRHCFNGRVFTDSPTCSQDGGVSPGYSEHNQVWAILSGAAGPETAQDLIRSMADPTSGQGFTPMSISTSFYKLRALSLAGGNLYDDAFADFWKPWADQLDLGLTTWEEDTVSHRSDCHAWGSAPIYEFMAEVAGLTPASPGWAAVRFQPRVDLYPEMEATVPLPMRDGKPAGTMHVSWVKTNDNHKVISLRFNLPNPRIIPVYVKLPGQPVQLFDNTGDLIFVVRSERKPGKSVVVQKSQDDACRCTCT